MKCVCCKKNIPDGSLFCNFCGSKQEVSQESIEDMVQKIQDKLSSVTGFCYSKTGVLRCKKWIKEFGFEIVYDSVETALSQYLIEDKNGNYTEDSVDEAFSKIGGIAKNKHIACTKPYISDVRRITNYAKKAFYINYYEMEDLTVELNNLLYYFFNSKQYEGKVEDILAMIRGSKDKHEFFGKIEMLKETHNLD